MNDPTADAATVYLIFFAAIFVLIIIPVFIVQWILYTRAGQAGWKALIPVYGTVVMAQIAKKPMWLGLVVGLLSIVYSFTSRRPCDSSHSSCNTATSSTSYSTFHTSRKCSRLKRHASNTARISESAPSAIGISEQNKKW